MPERKRELIVAAFIISILITACGGSGGSGSPASSGAAGSVSSPSSFSMSFSKVISLTTDGEGGSARPELISAGGRVFAVYLGHIQGQSRTFNVRIYDNTLENIIATRTIVESTADYGSPTDIRVTSDGQYAYAFYETHKPTSSTTALTYLWGAKFVLNDSFDPVVSTQTPITGSRPMQELQDGEELNDDPAPLLAGEYLYVITRLKYSISMEGRTAFRVRRFSKTDLTKLSEFDIDLSDVADGRARVSSLLYWNSSIYMALPTTVSNEAVMEGNDDGALSDIILVKMSENWTYSPSTGVHTLCDEPGDRENYITGLKTDGAYFYLTYKQATGSPPTGEQIAWIKVFDSQLNPVYKERVRSVTWGPGGGEIRPSLELDGARILSGQSSGEELGAGNAQIYVYDR